MPEQTNSEMRISGTGTRIACPSCGTFLFRALTDAVVDIRCRSSRCKADVLVEVMGGEVSYRVIRRGA